MRILQIKKYGILATQLDLVMGVPLVVKLCDLTKVNVNSFKKRSFKLLQLKVWLIAFWKDVAKEKLLKGGNL